MNPQYLTKPFPYDIPSLDLPKDPKLALTFSNLAIEPQTMQQRMQILQFMKVRALYLQRMPQTRNQKETIDLKKEIIPKQEICVKEEKSLKNENISTHENSPLSTPPDLSKTVPVVQAPQISTEGQYVQLSLRDQINFNAYLLRELEKIVRFIITNMGKVSQEEMENTRKQYLMNPSLLQIFDKLTMKYYSAKKCKEDIVRYILRKAFKVIKTAIGKEEKVCGKQATLLLCKRYFPANFDQIEQAGLKIKDGDELLEFMMPYRKNSKNKTMNTSFIGEVFSSQNFCKEYQGFLKNFDDLLKEDNDKKVDKLINFLAECVKKDSISKLGSFSRLPWLDVWMEDTKNVAASLLPDCNQNQSHHRSKKEEY